MSILTGPFDGQADSFMLVPLSVMNNGIGEVAVRGFLIPFSPWFDDDSDVSWPHYPLVHDHPAWGKGDFDLNYTVSTKMPPKSPPISISNAWRFPNRVLSRFRSYSFELERLPGMAAAPTKWDSGNRESPPLIGEVQKSHIWRFCDDAIWLGQMTRQDSRAASQ